MVEVDVNYCLQNPNDKNFFDLINFYEKQGNLEKAFYYAQLGAKNFYPLCQCKIAYMLENGIGTSKDEIESHKYYGLASSMGNIDAKHNLAIQYLYGIGCKTNIQKGMWLLEELASINHLKSLLLLSQIYSNGKLVQKDNELSFEYLLKAFEAGDEKHYHLIGLSYFNGIGVERNAKKAFDFFVLGSEVDNPICFYYLGVMFTKGIEVEKDLSKAYYYFLKGANLEEPRCMFNLGTYYQTGSYVEKDEEKAKYWFYKAHEKGFVK